jgi:hypothetical protein
MFYLPKATYPDSNERMRRPYFAIAFNSKLQRNDPADRKEKIKVADIVSPTSTVAFFERGLPKEQRVLETQTIKDYDGSGKGSAKSFVGRNRLGVGLLLFVDGHLDEFKVQELFTETGDFPFPPSGGLIWTGTPEENPNTVGR